LSAFSQILYQGPLITKADKALILLHGRGGTAKGILAIADLMCDNTVYIAALQAVNNTWYPHGFMDKDELNQPYLSHTIASIQALIEETAKHIPKEKIFLAGFSQGACLSLEISSRSATKYGGIIAFTGGLMGPIIDEKKYQGHFDGTKVFISDGTEDPFIPLQRCEESKQVMEKLGAEVILKVYPNRPHTILREELDFVRKHLFRL
jgi:phospholipase/carboxylesterase